MDPSSHSCCSTVVTSIVPWSILVASLLGSLHCLGMCGGLVIASTKSKQSVFLYHLGRLAGYMALGFISGMIGGVLIQFKWMPIVMGISYIALAGLAFTNKADIKIPFFTTLLKGILGLQKKVPQNVYSALMGLGSIFLPCGWLYAFVLAVSQTHNPWMGAFLMSVFWLGTVPSLTLAPIFLKKYLQRLSRPLSTAIYLSAGLLTLFFRS